MTINFFKIPLSADCTPMGRTLYLNYHSSAGHGVAWVQEMRYLGV